MRAPDVLPQGDLFDRLAAEERGARYTIPKGDASITRLQIDRWLDTRLDDDEHSLEAMAHVGGPMECEQIGRLFGISAESVRLLFNAACDHLREIPGGREVLGEYLEEQSRRTARVEPEPWDLGRVKLKGRATVGHWATFAGHKRKLRVLPTDHLSMGTQSCERLNARLSVPACALRWERANADDYHEQLETCRGCPVGEANHDRLSERLEAQERERSETQAGERARARPEESSDGPEGVSSSPAQEQSYGS